MRKSKCGKHSKDAKDLKALMKERATMCKKKCSLQDTHVEKGKLIGNFQCLTSSITSIEPKIEISGDEDDVVVISVVVASECLHRIFLDNESIKKCYMKGPYEEVILKMLHWLLTNLLEEAKTGHSVGEDRKGVSCMPRIHEF